MSQVFGTNGLCFFLLLLNTGRIDFYFDGHMNWGFELLIRGANILQHVNRFGKGKPYSLENMQHLVIDFHDKVPNRDYPDNYVAVVLDAAFTTADISFNKNDQIPLKFNN